jgi:2-methylcitrate dehydratase PrpD
MTTQPVEDATAHEVGEDQVDQIARFMASVDADLIPSGFRERVKSSILDCIGCGICGSRSEFAPTFSPFFAQLASAPAATIWGAGTISSAYGAAVTNATFVHSTELSETFTRAVVHPGNVIIPAVLALAERDGSTGEDVITSIALGYEGLIRFGLTVGRDLMLEQGLHPPSVVGGFGATLAAARLRRFDVDATRNALGVAACMTPTCLAAAVWQDASIKDMFEGMAAGVGVAATDLVAGGVTGISSVGTHWYQAIAPNAHPDRLTKGLGSEWHVDSGGLHFKERSLVAMAQPVFDATLDLLTHDTVEPRDIESIVVETTKRSALSKHDYPRSSLSAKSNLPFVVALVLTRYQHVLRDPHLVRTITPEVIGDPEMRRLAGLVTVQVDDTMETNFEESWPMKFEARVKVRTADGRTVVGYADIWPRTSSLTFDDIADKFENVTSELLPVSLQNEIVDFVRNTESVDDLGQLGRLLRHGTL